MGQKKGGRGRGARRTYVVSAEDMEKRNERHEASESARALRRGDSDSDVEGEEIDEEERQKQMAAMVAQLDVKEKKKGPAVIETANPNAAQKKFTKIKDMGAE